MMKNEKTRVLLVDDDVSIETTFDILAAKGAGEFDVRTATSSFQAIELLAQDRFDAVLLDLELLEGDGIETLRSIASHCNDLPIIVLSASENDRAILALDCGAQDYLVKESLTPELLARAIRYSAERQQLLEQVAAGNAVLNQKNDRLNDLYNTAHQFVDNVSHEFRTPLTVLREFCSLLREELSGPINEKQKKHLDVMATRIDDLVFMVDDMLDTSRLEAGLLSVWRRNCRVEEIVDHVYSLLERRANNRSITLARRIEPGLPEVYCDAEKIGRVIVNLVVNAIKFTPEGGKVDLRVGRGRRPHEISVGVTDTGVGISSADVQAIFQRFKQLDSGWLASTKGFGLGLNIAQELVDLNLGQMEVDSEPGVGSTFLFTIPTAEPLHLLERHLERLQAVPDGPREIAIISAEMRANGEGDATPVVDEFLQDTAGRNDLVLQVPQQGWCLAVACGPAELEDLLARFQQEWLQVTRNCPISNLPEIEMQVLGSWQLDTEHDSLVDYVRERFEQHDGRCRVGRRVLVVDDDSEVVMGLELRLEAEGFEVIKARDGSSGLDAAVQQHPDAIVLDVRMPGVDGIETLAALKSRHETKDIPVVMLSASLRDQQRALDHGARFFLQKPYDVKTLVTAVHSSMTGMCKA